MACKLRICKQCHQAFVPIAANQQYCKQITYDLCANCGKLFMHSCGDKRICCSTLCTKRYGYTKRKKFKVTCKQCGDVFYARSPCYKFCRKPVIQHCPVCGKDMLAKCGDPVKCCSAACRNKYISMRQGVNTLYTYTCVLCGKQYTTHNKLQKLNNAICSDIHYYNCEVCGKKFKIQNRVKHRTTCSEACRRIKVSESNKAASDENKRKGKETCLKKYGVSSFSKTPEFAKKVRDTSIKKYGVSNFTKTQMYIEKTKATNRRKYGCDWHTQTQEHHDSVIATNLKKYGSDNVSRSKYFLSKRMTDASKVDSLIEFRNDPVAYIEKNYADKPTLTDLSKDLGVVESSVGYILNSRNIQDAVQYHFSKMEDEVYEFLCTFIDSKSIVRNTYKVLGNLELDVYIPSKHFAIEVNPTFTHNSTKGIRSTQGKPIKYHLNKTEKCSEKDVFLFHLFGYEWTWKQDICKSMIVNALGATPNRIYARKCEIRDVSYADSVKFLDENHRQGNCTSSVRLGLYFNNKLVSLMTFSKMRSTMGTGNEDLSNCYELTRFCNLKYTNVVGAASKLFKHFVAQVDVARVRSFSDKAHTKGTLYATLGFAKLHENEPSYRWVDPMTDESYSRVSAQKRHLKKLLNDDTIDLSKTEVEIMEQHGYVRVYDCGTVLWQWTR